MRRLTSLRLTSLPVEEGRSLIYRSRTTFNRIWTTPLMKGRMRLWDEAEYPRLLDGQSR